MAHQARKRFGQHFLTDESVIDGIVQAIKPESDDNMVEIGPGLSALTHPLLNYLKHLNVVEIDRDLVQRLQLNYSKHQLSVYEADALEFDFASLGPQLRVVGNLPYNISTPLLFHLMTVADQVLDQHFMLQKEVVDRMVAEPGSAAYGRLSVMLQARYKMTALFEVPPNSFDPPPKVMSSIVRMVPLPPDRLQAKKPEVFESIVAKAFSQRRKMLRRVLGDYHVDWECLNIEPTARAENLSVADFIHLSDWIYAISTHNDSSS